VVLRRLLRVDDATRLLANVRDLGLVAIRHEADAQQDQRGRDRDRTLLHMRCT
jgi:hypothetical protein